LWFAFSPDGKSLAGSSGSGVQLWDLATGKSRTLTGHISGVTAVAYAPDGLSLASASHEPSLTSAGYDETVRVWDLVTGKSRPLTGHFDSVTAVDLRNRLRAVTGLSLPATLVKPFDFKRQNVAPPEKVGGNIIGGDGVRSGTLFIGDSENHVLRTVKVD
jgi:WD40 repeat protein